ncbi:uncharacterized protein [Drosophila pseudoobscura]|uniref:Uncharacterized protein n=1 Tax=Drosophila pseudoobscura pseudoobscura TaxID=46245 RepID=A0A6I8V1H0_DROPS|nr:uncharacterized protein LOC6900305 [Drosophila pseudoobscura]
MPRERDERRLPGRDLRGRAHHRIEAELPWPESFFAALSGIHIIAAAIVTALVAKFIVLKFQEADPGRDALVVSWHKDPTLTVYNSVEDSLDIRSIFKHIGDQVLSRKDTLDYMQQRLSTDQKIRWVALVGPPDVGKTMITDGLRKTFPWQDKVFLYSWNASAQPLKWRNEISQQLIHQLSNCGTNLIAIDMITWGDFTVGNTYKGMLLNRYYNLKNGMKMATHTDLLLYVFDLSSENLEQQLEKLYSRISNETPIVKFRSLDMEGLQDCLVDQASFTTEWPKATRIILGQFD